MTTRIFPTAHELAEAAAELFIADATAALAHKPDFCVALAGGSTPRHLYTLLATEPYTSRIDWARIHVFFGDERYVPPTHESSNYRMVQEALLKHVPIPEKNVHRIRGEVAPGEAAREYDADLRATLTRPLDLVLLGLGTDGHTASMFPGGSAVHEVDRWAAAEYVRAVSMWRITLTPGVINQAARVVFLVAGGEKANVLQRVIEGPRDPDVLPAQVVKGRSLIWMVDRAAAASLATEST